MPYDECVQDVGWHRLSKEMRVDERFGSTRILADVDRALAEFPGVLGFYAKNLTTGEEVGHRADAVMPTASVIKVGIMAELYRQVDAGEVDLSRRLTVTKDDYYGGTGVLKEFEPGVAPTILDLCRMMIVVSDNVATGMLVRLLGKDRINQSFDDWGLTQTELVWNIKLGDDIRQYAVSTPRDLGRLMELIASDGFLAPESTKAMRYHLSRQQHLEQLPRYLPHNQFASDVGIEQPLSVMNKIGNYMGMRADAMIVIAPGITFVVAAMNEGSPDPHFQVDHEGNVLNGRVGRAVFDAWVPSESIPAGW
jgi:beta-lactamase class A